MATKKTAIKKTTTPAKAVAKKSTPVKAPTRSKVPAEKMTKTQVIRFMAEQMEVPPKQVAGFFNLLIETATTQTRKLGEFTIPGLGKTCEGATSSPQMRWCRPSRSGIIDVTYFISISYVR